MCPELQFQLSPASQLFIVRVRKADPLYDRKSAIQSIWLKTVKKMMKQGQKRITGKDKLLMQLFLHDWPLNPWKHYNKMTVLNAK